MDLGTFWILLLGYGLTVFFEAPIILTGLAKRHSLAVRWFAAVWLSACTYPAVNSIIPYLFASIALPGEILAAESFAIAAECVLFSAAYGNYGQAWRGVGWDWGVIAAANLVSFGCGELCIRLKLL